MQFSMMILIGLVFLISGCTEDKPINDTSVQEKSNIEQSKPLPQSIVALQEEKSVVGMIEFFPTEAAAEEFPYYSLPQEATFIGLLEIDALCLMSDGSVVVYDNEAKNTILCKAASSESSFLSTLTLIKEFYEQNSTRESFDEAGAVNVRDRCTELAGGEEYRTFFVMLLGV